jgi:hypothetical protein
MLSGHGSGILHSTEEWRFVISHPALVEMAEDDKASINFL